MNQWPTSDDPYAPYHAEIAAKPKKKRRWPWMVAGGAVLFFVGIGVGGVQPATEPLEALPQASTQGGTPDVSTDRSVSSTGPSQAAADARNAASSVAAPPAATGIGSGTYIVGTDIEKGTYKSPGAEAGLFEFCSWSTKSGASSNSKLIDFGTANANEPMVVEIDDKVKAFESNGCEPWAKVE